MALVWSHSAYSQGYGDRLDLNPALQPFYHGVASGDPLTDRVIIWTRITTEEDVVYGKWRMAKDSLFTVDLIEGYFNTDGSKDYTVKVDVTGLEANTWYFYEFEALGRRSVRGRTKTAPSGSTEQYRIAFVNCTDFNTGYFNVYSRICERNDVDAIYHLGDYIYEYNNDRYLTSGLKVRDIEPVDEIITLTDYRTRYSWYRLDPELRKLHQQYPWVVTWDDHETANNSWVGGADNHQVATEGNWYDRKQAGAQAFHEWLPIRTSDSGDPFDIYRSFDIGNLAKFFVLETRLQYRSHQDVFIATFPQFDQSSRGMISPAQMSWLQSGLSGTEATWKVMVSPVIFSTLLYGVEPNIRGEDVWDGYPLQRNVLLSYLANNDIDNFTVISGDLHMALAFDIPRFIDNPFNINNYNPATGEGSIGVNFSGTSGSAVLCCRNTNTGTWQGNNPQMKYINVVQNGYNILDITQDLITCDYFYVNTVQQPGDTSDIWGASYCVENGAGHLEACDGPSVSSIDPFPFAPCWPRMGGDSIAPPVTGFELHLGDIIGVYPIPAADAVGVQFFLQSSGKLVFEIRDIRGQLAIRENEGQLESGLHYRNIDITQLPKGSYILTIRDRDRGIIASRRIIRL